jgi:hypothetical protein
MSHREKNFPPAVEALEPRELLSAVPLAASDLAAGRKLLAAMQPSGGVAEARQAGLLPLTVRSANAVEVPAFGPIFAADVYPAVTPAERLPEFAAQPASTAHAAAAERATVFAAVPPGRQSQQEMIGGAPVPTWQAGVLWPHDAVVQQIAEARLGNHGETSVATPAAAVRTRLIAPAGTGTPQSASEVEPLRLGLYSAVGGRRVLAGLGGSDVRSAVVTLVVLAAMPADELAGMPPPWGGFEPGSLLPGNLFPDHQTLLANSMALRQFDASPTVPWTEAAESDRERIGGSYEISPNSVLSLGLTRIMTDFNQLDAWLENDPVQPRESTVSVPKGSENHRGEWGTASDPGTWLRVELVGEDAELRLPLRRNEPTLRRIGEDLVSDWEADPQVRDEFPDPPACREVVVSAHPRIRTLALKLDESELATAGMVVWVGSGVAGDEPAPRGAADGDWQRPDGLSPGFRHEPILIAGLCGRARAFEIEAAADAVVPGEHEAARGSAAEASGSATEASEHRAGNSAAAVPDTALAPEMPPVDAAAVGFFSVLILSGRLFVPSRRVRLALRNTR